MAQSNLSEKVSEVQKSQNPGFIVHKNIRFFLFLVGNDNIFVDHEY